MSAGGQAGGDPAPAPDMDAWYISQPKIIENRQYEWLFPTWSCGECSALFLFEVGGGDVLQRAVHTGGQWRRWPVGQSGMCPRCGVYWLQVPQQ